LKLGIDTGAEVNLISSKTFSKIKRSSLSEKDSLRIRGLNEDTHELEQVTIKNTIVKGKNYKDMDFVVMDLSNMNKAYGVELDGILGYSFLASQKFSINYIDQKLYIWKQVFPALHKPNEGSILADSKQALRLSSDIED